MANSSYLDMTALARHDNGRLRQMPQRRQITWAKSASADILLPTDPTWESLAPTRSALVPAPL